jgi:modulator of FtsH protease HflK
MPWNDHPNDNRPNNPWGEPSPRPSRPNGGGSGNLPPDFDAFMQNMQRQFRQFFPGQDNPFKLAGLAVLAVLALWLASGFYFIQPNENAVVLTFGRYTKTEGQSGLKYAFPWPVQQVVKVDVTTERRIEVGFNSGTVSPYNSRASAAGTADESLMLTGDENIIDIDFVVMWRIGDAKEYLFELRSPEDTIKMVAESAMREVIARTPITAALTDARGRIQADTKALMQKILDEYQSGVTINNIQLLKVDPPTQVIDAFNDVQRARAEAERMENEAQAYRNDIIPRARGEAQKTLEDARAYKQETIERAKGDANRFNAVYAAYAKSKNVTTERMYLETVEEVLRNATTIVLDNEKGAGALLPYLPLAGGTRASSMPPAPDAR